MASLPFIFANLTSGVTSELDANFSALGALTAIPCTATGSANVINLTPFSVTPTVSGYANYQPFTFIASNTNSGSAVAAVLPLGDLTIFKDSTIGPVTLTGNEIVLNNQITLTYDSALASGSGGFHLQPTVANAAAPTASTGYARNLQIEVTGNASLQASADVVIMMNSLGAVQSQRLDTTLSTGSTGLNGLDTGTVAVSTWYAVYAVSSGLVTGAVLTAAVATVGTQTAGSNVMTGVGSTTGAYVGAPIFGGGLPAGTVIDSIGSGTLTTSRASSTNGSSIPISFFPAPAAAILTTYSYWARVGAVRTNASAVLLATIQTDNRAQYVVGGPNIANMPIMSSGSTGYLAGTSSAAVFTAVAVNTFVPPTATAIRLVIYSNSGHSTVAAPNNAYAGDGSTTNPPPMANRPQGSLLNASMLGELVLETSNTWWGSDYANNALFCLGWVDNL